jgi:hypothetical protein
MRERREISAKKTAAGSADAGCQRVPDQLEPVSANSDMVGTPGSSNPGYFGHFRISPVAKQTLVKLAKGAKAMDKTNADKPNETPKQPRKKAIKSVKKVKAGRPASSSDVTLVPQFRNPVDIKRLGKAFVAIAMKLPAKPDETKGKNFAEGNHEPKS